VRETAYEKTGVDWARGLPNHPVVNVWWYAAREFCQWLSAVFRQYPERLPKPLRGLIAAGWRVDLPSEAEWENAARADTGRIYSWGNGPDPDKANYLDTGIDRTSAVGCFRTGATPSTGIEELSGNVEEWTRSQERHYPYDQRDGREETGGKGPRVVRGGAFDINSWGVRVNCRPSYRPGEGAYNRGFRVVMVPPSLADF
jgi:formylglycine-generating enzyme required for sulfatase activity